MPYPYYGGYMPSYYQPMQMNQPAVPPAAPVQQAQAANNGIIWVQGEEGAKGYLVAPGHSVLLMDSEGNHFFLKSTDNQGMPQPLRIFDYTERTAQRAPSQPAAMPTEEFVTRQEFEALAATVNSLASPRQAPMRTETEAAE